MIQLDQVRVTFNPGTPLENPALRGLSLTIPEGQFVTVIGSNGAGKSTLLNALSGEIRIDSGQVNIDDRDVTRLPTHRRASDVARVFQDPMAGTCENLSIEENLSLAMRRGRNRGLRLANRKEYQALFCERLSTLGLGLENRLDDRMGLLSGGQRQAVSLLMATLQPMKILLLDEHTAALDPKTADFVLQLTQDIIEQQQLTAMMVTHSMRQALDVGHRTLMLHEGQIAFDIAGDKRDGLEVADLLELFARNKGEELADDSLLLG
ncbi:ABC transporter ATP-binding protein [Aestuariirhabdus sp. Z084]|uniref:ABC transporter ATP-binding protein n=1 Tax=Aestuariirhabdus haliotis TaxID=2918751 RepID=UPI00201B4250|nr:ABC transporter ATP-binding protein [Aestuariirhabdus haliotis]MCL6416861.1 ABC transporter ATP-binding protein [Aestuariirhabdus haliotis]MCL6420863.1 ABC transporter ATP-binding protein [Aestuariirhabdus haliotis]